MGNVGGSLCTVYLNYSLLLYNNQALLDTSSEMGKLKKTITESCASLVNVLATKDWNTLGMTRLLKAIGTLSFYDSGASDSFKSCRSSLLSILEKSKADESL